MTSIISSLLSPVPIGPDKIFENNKRISNQFRFRKKSAPEVLDSFIASCTQFDPNFQDETGVPLIAHAVMHKEAGITSSLKLISLGADTNVYLSVKKQKPTSLLIISARYKTDVFFEILKNPAIDINFKQAGNFSALRACLSVGFHSGIIKLIDKGAAVDWDTCIEVHKSHQWPAFKSLLEKHVPSIKNKDGQNLIHSIAQQRVYYKGMKDAIALLSTKNDINESDNFGFTPLDYAIKTKNYDIINELLMHGASLFKLNSPTQSINKVNPTDYHNLLAEIFTSMKTPDSYLKDYNYSVALFEKYKIECVLSPPRIEESKNAFKV